MMKTIVSRFSIPKSFLMAAGVVGAGVAVLLTIAAPARTMADNRPVWAAHALDPFVVGSGSDSFAGALPANGSARGRKNRRVASLGGDADLFTPPSVTGRGIVWNAPSSCLSGQLASVVADVAANFGGVRVNSTCRSRGHNSRVGGARHSHHLTGNAVDFRVWGNVRAVHAYLRSHPSVGGLKHYGGGLFHIDTGARRPW